ncbi:polyamine aminopropyltransferase [Streptomyces chumphonensis]|uniref:Polyamine aminopropyltransferase n=1 Tax=Streptomyces chumphonensis TaxID=1214925 RepID=A0A927ICA8_9ACTN|nr:polyamine aminopropyltransferase [Streptomyces chumphonensis]MBD3931862.1 polyamine aminopropyltransferase [Streptomyces chumphonensis]
MIDQPVSGRAVQPDRSRPAPEEIPLRLPVRPGLGRFLVLCAVFVCAACGLVYELALVAMASYLTGDSVTQASIVLSVMVFAMGVGSLLAKRLRCRAVACFGMIECVLALVGGGSVMALYAAFAWFGASGPVLVAFSLAIGVLIGAEMPLLMTLIQRIRAQDAGGAVADLFAADYVGALVGGLAFPFLLLPVFGQLTGALLVGVVNVLAGGLLVLWLFRHDLGPRQRAGLLLVFTAVLSLLGTGAGCAGPFEEAARRAVYGGSVRVAVHSDVQEIVLTDARGSGRHAGAANGPCGLELYLDGRLRVCGGDEARYHQALVRPAMAAGPHARVLVLGGGDGLALREVLRHPDVAEVTVVDIDPEVVALARSDPRLRALNEGAFTDPRARVVTADAFEWLRSRARTAEPPYDVIVSGLPDPRPAESARLYSQEFYGLLARALSPDGRFAVHAGSVSGAGRVFWTVEATLRAAGLRPVPYAVDGRASVFPAGTDRVQRAGAPAGHPADWGFLLAAPGAAPPLLLDAAEPRPRAFDAADLAHAAATAERQRRTGLAPSTLLHPRYGG